MEGIKRKPFQGVTNIIRFNWHYYLIAFIAIAILFWVKSFLHGHLNIALSAIIFLAISLITISLLISYYIYDYSDLYSFKWIDSFDINSRNIININAGFDETSNILLDRFPFAKLAVFDFYDPEKHTEISIKRARKHYPAITETVRISTNKIPLENNSVDFIFLIFSAHEIRNTDERIAFFQQLQNIITDNGRIIVVEHLRDHYNFIAFIIGYSHFFSAKVWKNTFSKAGLVINTSFKITPFISTFILKKNGNTS